MNSAFLFVLVPLAVFGLVGLVLSVVLALAWRAGLNRMAVASLDLLSLRLLPAGGALLIALTVVLPAFRTYEPHREDETAGPLLIALAAFAVTCFVSGLWRAWRASRAARVLLRSSLQPRNVQGHVVHTLGVSDPFVGVIGAWHARMVTTRSVESACSGEEFEQVLAHEAAHVATHDNLKLLALVAAPDPLAWIPLGQDLLARWRNVAEQDADDRATGQDPRRRLALASALIRVARLRKDHERSAALGMLVAEDDVPGRVLRLLAPPAKAGRAVIASVLVACGVLLPLIALPHYAGLYDLVERLVRFG